MLSKQQESDAKTKRGAHPNSKANLARGRNKHGAPRKGLSWKELITRIGDEETSGAYRRSGATWKEAVVRAAFKHAIKGNAAMLRELIERSDDPRAVTVNVREVEQKRKRRIEKTKRALVAAFAVSVARANESDG